jgi:hypothetical protein
MPQLVEYTNRENIAPTDRGTEAFVQQGRRIGAASNQVAESLRDFGNRTAQNIGSAVRDAGDAAVQYQQHREISQGVGTYALLQDQMITQWNDIAKNADPNDPTVRQQFIEQKLTPALQKWTESFGTEGGQKWAMERQNALLNHMYEKTTADMGTLAGQAVMNNLKTFGNTSANTAAHDPSSVDHLLNEADQSVGALVDSSPNLKGAAAGQARTAASEKIKEGIVKSGAMAAIKMSSDPEQTADEWTRKYPQYITPEEAHALAQNARTVIRARDYDDRMAKQAQKEADTERSNGAVSEYMIEIANHNPRISGDPLAQKMLSDDRLLKTDRRNLLSLYERELKPETDSRISAATFNGLLRQLRQPNVDAAALEQKAWDARLTDAGKPGSLTQPDFDRFRKELMERKTPDGLVLGQDRSDFFKRYISTIDPERDKATGMGGSALGDQKIYQAERDARQMEAQLRAQGKDPRELYNPNSPDFFGRQITRYRPTLQDAVDFKAQEIRDKGPAAATPAPAPSGSWWPSWLGGSAPQLPPNNERQVGHVYSTPNGPKKWTGTGWVDPAEPPKNQGRAPQVPVSR